MPARRPSTAPPVRRWWARHGWAWRCWHTDRVGFNPHRVQRRRRSDYVFVVAAVAAAIVLLLWALVG